MQFWKWNKDLLHVSPGGIISGEIKTKMAWNMQEIMSLTRRINN